MRLPCFIIPAHEPDEDTMTVVASRSASQSFRTSLRAPSKSPFGCTARPQPSDTGIARHSAVKYWISAAPMPQTCNRSGNASKPQFVFQRTSNIHKRMLEIGMHEHIGDELVECGTTALPFAQGAILHDGVMCRLDQGRSHVDQGIDDYQVFHHRGGIYALWASITNSLPFLQLHSQLLDLDTLLK